jgi:uncharacterized protein HemX
MDTPDDVTPPGGMRSGARTTTPTPGAPVAPKIITAGQTRVMLTVLVVAVVAAAGIVGLWWFQR